MSALGFRVVSIAAVLGLFPLTVCAQLKDAQDRGWGMIKEGYALVSSMKDNAGNRTKGNYDNALKVLRTGMAEMRPYLEKIGEKVADDDRSYAAGLRDAALGRWKEVAEAHQKLLEAVEKVRVAEELAEFTPELEKLKTALEQYETTIKAAYDNSKDRWEKLKAESEKVDTAFKAATEKIDNANKQLQALIKDELSMYSDLSKIDDDEQKIAKGVWDILQKRLELEDKMRPLDRSSSEYTRLRGEWNKTFDVTTKLIEIRTALARKERDIEGKLERAEEDDAKLHAQLKAFGEEATLAAPAATVRFLAWNSEFPLQNYSFQSLR